MASVNFYSEEIKVNLPEKRKLKIWIKSLVEKEKRKIGDINIIFCSDDYLLKLNEAYLQHDTYTDVITFDFCEDNIVSGDIFISWIRTKENAEKFHVEHLDEVHRVIIHGVLHLLGYEDKTTLDKKKMTEAEDKALKALGKL